MAGAARTEHDRVTTNRGAADPATRDAAVCAAVLLAAATVEARVNEVLAQISSRDVRVEPWALKVQKKVALIAAVADSPAKALPERIDLMSALLFDEAEQIDRGSPPWQAADLVRRLRNCLIHPQPSLKTYQRDWADGEEATSITKLLTGLATAMPDGLGNSSYQSINAEDPAPLFPGNVMTAEVAEWAVDVADQVLSEIGRLLDSL